MLHRFGIQSILAALALSLSGCGTLYSEARNKQGEELKTAYAKVDFTASVAVSRKNLNALLDEQLRLEDELWRQFGLTQAHLAATSWTVGTFKKSINDRMTEIIGEGFLPSTVINAKTDTARRAVVVGGAYNAALKELKNLEEDRAAAVKQKDDAVQAVKVASVEYNELLKSLSKTPEHAKKLDEAKKKLVTAFDKLASLQSAVGREFITSAKVEGINEFLTNYDDIRAGKKLAQESSPLAVALALFPDIQDKVDKAWLDAQKPRLLPLVMAKQVEQVKLDAAQRNVARINATIDLKRQQVDIFWNQANELDTALTGVGTLRDNQALRPLLLKPGRPPSETEIRSRIYAWRPLALYLKAQVPLRAQENKLQHQIIALGYEEPLSLAESNLHQWKALLDPSVELLVFFGASGLKAKDVQDFINTAALLWIAAKVN